MVSRNINNDQAKLCQIGKEITSRVGNFVIYYDTARLPKSLFPWLFQYRLSVNARKVLKLNKIGAVLICI